MGAVGNLPPPPIEVATPIVLLMRHAKAGRPAGSPDRDRPLTDRGRRDARAIGKAIAGLDPSPPLVVASPATRTIETAQEVLAGAGWSVIPAVREALYRGGVEDVLAVIGEAEVPALLLIGHEPTWSATVQALTGAAVRMVTGAVVAIEVVHPRPRVQWMLTPRLVGHQPTW